MTHDWWVVEEAGPHLYAFVGFLIPAWRRQGVAQALLRVIEAHARETGESLLELNVRLVLDGNIRLFEAAGFRITEQRSHPGFAVPTYHVMQKRLG